MIDFLFLILILWFILSIYFSAVIFRWWLFGRRRPIIPESNFPISELPNEMLLLVFRELPVVDRLRCESVNRRWNGVMWNYGWNAEKKLDKAMVFEGAGWRQIRRFNHKSMVALFLRLGPGLTELDLGSFGNQFQSSLKEISGSLRLLPKLEKLNIEDLDLAIFLDALPWNLRELRTNGPFSDLALDKIAEKCPSLNSIRFSRFENVSLSKLSAFFRNYRRLKTLHLQFLNTFLMEDREGQIEICSKELEELIFIPGTFRAQDLEIVVGYYKRLRTFKLSTWFLSSEELLTLAEMPCLENLTVEDLLGKFTDPVLIAIARRGQLKGLSVTSSNVLTDASIAYLLDKCKSLVSLSFDGCPWITVRSVEAVVAEVRRRHGNRLLPTGPSDPRIFTIKHIFTGVNRWRARRLTGNNPWIRLIDPLLPYLISLI